MKVGLVIEHFDPRRGGAERWTHQFVEWLLRLGHEVHVVASGFATDFERTGMIAHRLPAASGRVEFAREAERKLDSLSLDVVHDMGHGWHCDLFQPHGGSRVAAFEQNLRMLPGWLRMIKRRGSRCLPRYRDFRQLTMAQYMSQERIFIALSRMVARDFERFHGVPSDRVRLIYNGVDTARFSPGQRWNYRRVVRTELGVADDEVLLLIVAHNFRLKGVPALLAAVGLLAADGWPVRLAVIGGKHQASYSRLARRRGAGGITSFMGPVDNPVAYYAAADVYVQPTWYDPCSLVVLEALASGLPVITSRFNGAGELITPGREGWIVDDPNDPFELAARLRPLFDSATREPMSIAARALAEAHNFEKNGRDLLAVYDEIVARRRRHAA
jgi:UDP-glucose:(heptosyl)LPS alpha-1,3-glucosyltransferase